MENAEIDTKTAVPPNRLGQLLAEARLRHGTDLERLATKGNFTVGELSDLEAGHRILDEDLVRRVTTLYEIDCGPIVPQRSGLVIDLDDQLLTSATHALPLDSSQRDHVLERYLSLVYLLRNNTPGSKVTLRDKDVDVLAASLAERRELIEEQLLLAMDPGNESVNGLIGWFRKRLWVPAAGALVGATSIGALVLLSTPATGQFVSPEELLAEEANNPDAQSNAGAIVVPNGVSASSTSAAPPPVSRPASVVASEAIAVTEESQLRGEQAEALLPFTWQEILPDWTINYRGYNTAYRGLTYPYDQTIEVFVRPTDTTEEIAAVLAHEIGHAVDVEYMSADERNTWLEIRGIADSPWWSDAFASDFESGAGDFAEAFAVWAIGDESSSEIAGQPTEFQLETLIGFIEPLA